jgi:hypothetical protein
MGKKDADEDETERAKRIAELKRQAEELAGGKMVDGEMEDTPPEIAEPVAQTCFLGLRLFLS